MRLHFRRPTLGTVFGLVALTVSLCGVAVAQIPSSEATIYGCYARPNGDTPPYPLYVVDSSSQCKGTSVLLPWNQTGPAGPAGQTGPAGPTGPTGATGPAGPAFELSAGAASSLQADVKSATTQLGTLEQELTVDERQQATLLSAGRVLAADIPDARLVKQRIAKLVGTQLANQLLPGPLGNATWPQGTSPALQNALDSVSEMSQEDQLEMQMAQQAFTQSMQTVSNILKTCQDTENAIIQNLE